MLKIHLIVNAPISSNCYVLYDKAQGNDCIIIDPGSKDDIELRTYLSKESLKPKYIVLTHEHFDHCMGVNSLVDYYHIPIICSQLCSEAIKDKKRNCSVFYDDEGFIIKQETICVESINYHMCFWDYDIDFYSTPGHTEASICMKVVKYLFTGDTLIKNKKTVTKLPTGSDKRMIESMALFARMKGNGYMVFPGHEEAFDLDMYNLSLSLTGIMNWKEDTF